MLFIYDKKTDQVSTPQQTNFSSHLILERQHIEKWIENNPDILGEDLLVLTTEYDKFDKTNERLDLLAMDPDGNLVVIELKRDDSGKNVDMQAIKYASYCSTLTLDDVIQIHKDYLEKQGDIKNFDEVRKIIMSFIKLDDFEQINDRPRIIIVSNNFRPEITASVMWLNKFGLNIKCVRLIPYEIDNETIGLEAVTIIPLPEAEEFIIRAERKENASTTLTVTQQKYIEFYNELIDLVSSDIKLPLQPPKPGPYYQIQTGVSGIHFEWAFHGRPRNSFGVELHFESGKKDQNKKMLTDIVSQYKSQLEADTGEKLKVVEDWGNHWSRIYFEKQEGNMTDDLKQWAIKTMIQLYKIVFPYFQNEN
jgi:hypothetical protein